MRQDHPNMRAKWVVGPLGKCTHCGNDLVWIVKVYPHCNKCGCTGQHRKTVKDPRYEKMENVGVVGEVIKQLEEHFTKWKMTGETK